MKEDVARVRTICLVSHSGAGKTSLAEAMLFDAGETTRLGKVDEGTSVMDYEPEELKRRLTISTAFNTLAWNKRQVTAIDTPGDFNFVAETKTSMQGADAALVLVDAIDGVRVQTEVVWEFADEFALPRAVFVSKMDKERADFEKAVEDIRGNFGNACVPVVIPVGAAETFKGVVNVLQKKASLYSQGDSGKFEVTDMPAEVAALAAEYRDKITDIVAEANDELLERYLESGELTDEELLTGLRAAMCHGKIIPILCGSGSMNVGVQPLLDFIADYFPSPLDRGPKMAKMLAGDAETECPPDPDAPFCALVVKTVSDPYAGRLSVIRIYSGTMTSDMNFYNSNKRTKERFGALLRLKGKAQEAISGTAGPGEIVAVAKLKETTTGDTLCDDKKQVLLPPITLPHAIYSLAVTAKNKGDEDKVFGSLTRLMEEDLALKLERNEMTREMIISGMGEIHIEATVDKLKRKFGVEVNLSTPKVHYRETIKGKARVQGRHKKQTGGRGQYGDCWIEMAPLPRGSGFQFVDKIVGGAIPRNFIPAVEKGIVEALGQGTLAGYPVVDFEVALVDGSYHDVDSSEMAFKIAGSIAFKKAMEECRPTILEPIMTMEITVPDDFMGDVIGDLNSRRGKVLGMESKGKKQIIKAQVPLAEVQRYAPDLRSMTAGRGMFTMRFSHYEEVPGQAQEKIIAAAKAEAEAERK